MVFYHNIDPAAFSLFGFDVYWYGIIFVLGFVIAYFFMQYLVKDRGLNLKKNDIDDFFLWLIISVLVGARLIYVIVYNFWFYLSNPLHILHFWEGGLSFHGGLIGAAVMGLIFCKIKKCKFYDLADIVVIPLALGLMLGRIGNFINGELYGRVTGLPWGFKFDGADGFRHPSQIYESFKNLAIFLILWFNRNKNLPKGFLFWLFVTLYGVFRFTVEFARQPDPQIGVNGLFFGWMSMGQILCSLMVVVGLTFLVLLWRKHKLNKHS